MSDEHTKSQAADITDGLTYSLVATNQSVQEQLEVILRGISDGITLQAPDSSLLYANEPAARIIGYASGEELVQTPVDEIVGRFEIFNDAGEAIDVQELPSRKALRGIASERVVRFRVRATGREFWSHVKSLPVHNDAGQLQYVVNFFHDITKQKRAEQETLFLSNASAILASSLDYQTTLAAVSNLLVPQFADWCIIYVTDSKQEITRIAVSHVDPDKIAFAEELGNTYPPDPKASYGLYAVMRTGKPEIYTDITDEMLQQSAQSEEHLEVLRNVGMRSAMIIPMAVHGTVVGCFTMVSAESNRNYTQEDLIFAEELAQRAAIAIENSRLYSRSLQLNEELESKVKLRTAALEHAQLQDRANLQRFRNMIAHLPMGAIATDQNNMVLEVNDEFCRMFQLGTKAADLLGTNSQDFLQELYGKAADPEKFSRDGRETVDQKKKVLDYEIILKDGRVIERDYLPIFDEDRFLGQLFLYNDVTRERRIDAAKSEFMSLASHQLRTPLTTIRWALGRLQKSEDSLDESQKRMLDAAKGASVLMAETINAMLTISRIEARQITIQAEDIDVHQLVETIRRDVQREYEPKNQSFSIHVQGSSLVRSDENLLKEIVTNLIRNAIKYTKEEGKIDVYICGTQASVSIQVVDNGLGIPLHQQNRVFQKFFRADNAISREPDGTGLGLYLVSITIKLLGGSIEFESEEDKGTTFTITLPVSPPHPS